MVQQQEGSAGQAAAPVLAGSAALTGCLPVAAPLAHVAGQALQAGTREPAASGASGPVASAADRALAHLRQRLPEVAALYARLRLQACEDTHAGATSGKEPRPRLARRKALAAQQRLAADATARAADGGEADSVTADGGSSAAAEARAAAAGNSPGDLGASQNGALDSRLPQQTVSAVLAELGQPRHAAGPLPQQAAGTSATKGASPPAAAPEPWAASALPGSGEGKAAAAKGEQQLPAGTAESGQDTDSGGAAVRAEGAPVGKVAERAQRLQRQTVAALRCFAAGLPGAERWPLAGVAGLMSEPGARPTLCTSCGLVRLARVHGGFGPPPQGWRRSCCGPPGPSARGVCIYDMAVVGWSADHRMCGRPCGLLSSKQMSRRPVGPLLACSHCWERHAPPGGRAQSCGSSAESGPRPPGPWAQARACCCCRGAPRSRCASCAARRSRAACARCWQARPAPRSAWSAWRPRRLPLCAPNLCMPAGGRRVVGRGQIFSVSSFVQTPNLSVQLRTHPACPALLSCRARLHSEAVCRCCAAVRGCRGGTGQGLPGCAARAGLGHAGGRARRRARGWARRSVKDPQ
jgi:hypothetical protein